LFSYCEVSVSESWVKSLTYRIPIDLAVSIGQRVHIELNNKETIGLVIEIHNNEPNYKTLEIKKVIETFPIVTKELIDLAYWMTDFYQCSLGEAFSKILPAGKRRSKYKQNNPIKNGSFIPLNSDQKLVCESIWSSSEPVHLLFGITGSGKTEVYITLIQKVLEETDGCVIYLLPEIGLTFPALLRLEKAFPSQIAIFHSQLKSSQRFQSYLEILNQQKRIAVGTRSAVFAPVFKPSLIILDEEHDSSYKEHSTPRYHARQIAWKRIKESNGKLILGSATPTLELFYQAKIGQIGFHRLSRRAVPGAKLPEVYLLTSPKGDEILSGDLQFKIQERIQKKEQVILLLNRRGYSPFLFNEKTKEFINCPNCSTTLCFHKNSQVRCHLCGHLTSLQSLNKIYPGEIQLLGSGTQKLEEKILEKFPNFKIERLDQDVTENRGAFSDVIDRFSNGEIDILTGTQMIAKGIDIANVTLVGVIQAHLGLGLPDFRASERTFALLSQVAGRAGRGNKGGEVFFQTNNQENPVLLMAMEKEYEKFFDWEIAIRKEMEYPPFQRLLRLVFRSPEEGIPEKDAELFRKLLDENNDKEIRILGPAPCPFYKIEKNYRYHMILKSPKISLLQDTLRKVKPMAKLKGYLEIDFDPLDLV